MRLGGGEVGLEGQWIGYGLVKQNFSWILDMTWSTIDPGVVCRCLKSNYDITWSYLRT